MGSLALAACAAVARSGEERRERVELSLLTPDAGWVFRVREARQTEDEVWVWAEVQRKPGPAAQQLTTVTTSVELPAGKPRRVLVTGKTWGWENDEPYTFLPKAPDWPADAEPLPVTPSADGGSSPPQQR